MPNSCHNVTSDHVLNVAYPCGAHVRDGESHNLSWNCGEEGETTSPAVLRLRGRQMRNMAAALLLSHGVPMVQMGDEYGHTKVPSVSVHHKFALVCRCT